MDQVATPMAFYRGGTSKAVFIDQRDVPIKDERDFSAWILAVYGSPDTRQIDGLGGADPLTSKFAVVGPPTRADADVDYTFYQVSVDHPVASKDMNCGNISSAVGPYAIEQGFVEAKGDETLVRVHATNFDQMLYITVKTKDGKPRVLGDQKISGVPGTGAPITLDFHELVGTHGKGLLPTGNPQDTIDVEGVGTVTFSVVDLANYIVFAKASDFGLKGTERPDALSDDVEFMNKVETFRKSVGVKLGFATDLEDAKFKCTLSPFLALIAPPQDWEEFSSHRKHKASECDFLAFSFLDGAVHKAYMATGSSCTAIAALLPGTLVNEIAGKTELSGTVTIGHPSGTLQVSGAIAKQGDGYKVTQAALIRTARRLMDGQVFAAVDKLPWHKESGGLPHMVAEQPAPQKSLHNETFHAS